MYIYKHLKPILIPDQTNEGWQRPNIGWDDWLPQGGGGNGGGDGFQLAQFHQSSQPTQPIA